MESLCDPALIRAVCLFIPILFVVGVWIYQKPSLLANTGAYLATAWILAVLPLLNLLAFQFEWWSFHAEGGLWMGTPFDLILGWSLLWGFFPAIAFPTVSLPVLAGLFLSLDVVLMPACSPVVQLGKNWFWGNLLFIFVLFIPAQQIARKTSTGNTPGYRAFSQMMLFTIFFFVDISLLIIMENFSFKQYWYFWIMHPINLQLLFLLAVPGLSAVQEFVIRGDGTPLPYDPPKRLVTTGVYSYVRNPMQLTTTLLFFALSLLSDCGVFYLAGTITFVYSAGFASWHEDPEMLERYGKAWKQYHLAVPKWIPCFRPRFIPDMASAILYYDSECSFCRNIAQWIQKRNPRNLRLLPAQNHPSRDLERLTYDPGDGREEEGVAALGRGLEHLHLGWAYLSWIVRLPIILQFIQLITDVVWLGPRKVCRILIPDIEKKG